MCYSLGYNAATMFRNVTEYHMAIKQIYFRILLVVCHINIFRFLFLGTV